MSQQSSTVQSKSTTASHKPASPTGPVPLTQEQQQQVGGAGDRTGLPKGGW